MDRIMVGVCGTGSPTKSSKFVENRDCFYTTLCRFFSLRYLTGSSSCCVDVLALQIRVC